MDNVFNFNDMPVPYKICQNIKSCSDSDLIAAILGEKDTIKAKELFSDSEFNLIELSEKTAKQLQNFYGIGETKAAQLLAAFELGKRLRTYEVLERPQIRCSQDAYHILAAQMMDLSHEEFWILILNRANRVIGRVQVSKGGLSGTIVDTKKLFQQALQFPRINALVLSHNHPSSNLLPSQSDIELTRKIVDAGLLLDIKILDHIIIAGSKYMSFMDEGYL